MRYSLISRDWIADCVEIMHEAYSAVGLVTKSNNYHQKLIFSSTFIQDAIIALGGCDKTGMYAPILTNVIM